MKHRTARDGMVHAVRRDYGASEDWSLCGAIVFPMYAAADEAKPAEATCERCLRVIAREAEMTHAPRWPEAAS